MISQKEFVNKIKEIAPKISSQSLYLALSQPEDDARPHSCFLNVLEKMAKDCGNICFGWTFSPRVSPEYGGYILVTHHAIWQAPDNKLIDVTPFTEDPKQHPYSQNNCVVFLMDESAKPVELSNLLAPLPNKFFALNDDNKLVNYVNELNEKEQIDCQEIYKENIKDNQITGFISQTINTQK